MKFFKERPWWFLLVVLLLPLQFMFLQINQEVEPDPVQLINVTSCKVVRVFGDEVTLNCEGNQ